VNVLLRAWGVTDADVEYAVQMASWPSSRRGWDFAVERLTSASCPLNVEDPKSIAGEADYGWAYVAYPADAARS
jgi:hypothetical protein